MRLSYSRSKNSTSLYAIESTYINGKHSSRVVEKLGTVEELRLKLGGQDVIAWAKAYVAQLNKDEAEGRRLITIRLDPSQELTLNENRSFNGGYLFIQAVCYGLKLQEICREIGRKYRYEYDMNAILTQLIYTRILYGWL
ncbi:hypothetical protein AGMMS49992_33980 [Clostridia bacterium]|nr:hypothetical protein AGMMS49992_33980 [Clostridia bacterium]